MSDPYLRDIFIFTILGIFIVLILGFIFGSRERKEINEFLENASKITFGMSKAEVFELLNNREPNETTRNVSKGTERYRWSIGQNVYIRRSFKGVSFGSSIHGKHYVTVVFKNDRVIEVSIK